MLGGNRQNNRFWRGDTAATWPATSGVADPLVETQVVCIDRHRQWRVLAQRPQQRHAPLRSAHADGPGPLESRGRG